MLKGKIKNQNTLQARTVSVGPPSRLLDMSDIDSAELDEGSTLIYNSTTGKFETKSEINNPNTKIIGGSF